VLGRALPLTAGARSIAPPVGLRPFARSDAPRSEEVCAVMPATVASAGVTQAGSLKTAVEIPISAEVLVVGRNPTAPQFTFSVASVLSRTCCNQNHTVKLRGSNCRF
jgi:hypothetical protein